MPKRMNNISHSSSCRNSSTEFKVQRSVDPDGEYYGEEHLGFNRRVVCFADEVKVDSFGGVTDEEACNVWYTCADYANFKGFHEGLGMAVIVAKKNQVHRVKTASWDDLLENDRNSRKYKKKTVKDNLLAAYMAFRELQSNEEVVTALESIGSVTMDEHTVGLIQFAVPEIMADYIMLRKHVLLKIELFQRESTTLSPEKRDKMIYEQCRLASQAARLFAQYTAQLAAESF